METSALEHGCGRGGFRLPENTGFRSELQMRSHSHWSADALPPESSATGAVRTVRKLSRLSEKSRQPARASNMKSSLRIVITENPV